MPRALIAGTALTILLNLLVNVVYLAVLPLTSQFQHAPSDRVADGEMPTLFSRAGQRSDGDCHRLSAPVSLPTTA